VREGDVEGALAALHAADARRRPESMLHLALLLYERQGSEDLPAAAGLLERLIRDHPGRPEAEAARILRELERERHAARAATDSLAARVDAMEADLAERTRRVSRLEQEVALRDSLVVMLTRMAGQLESQLESERQELEQLRRTLEQLMEVDLDRPPVPTPSGSPSPRLWD
jgi:hypothetical protein